jgi:hypothetical protein
MFFLTGREIISVEWLPLTLLSIYLPCDFYLIQTMFIQIFLWLICEFIDGEFQFVFVLDLSNLKKKHRLFA